MPMCGCGATSIGLPSTNDNGPYRSRKHHGPTIRRCRTGSARRMSSAPRLVWWLGYASSMPSPPHEEERPPLVAHLGQDGELRLLLGPGAVGGVDDFLPDGTKDGLHVHYFLSRIAQDFEQGAGEDGMVAVGGVDHRVQSAGA